MDWDSKVTKKHIKEAKAEGLTLVGEGKNKLYRTYRFNSCKHEQEITLGSVRTNRFTCQQCIWDRRKKFAKAVGLIFLGEGKKGKKYKFFRCKKCEQTQHILSNDLEVGRFRCRECKEARHHKDAEEAGLTYKGSGRNNFYRLYIFNECKHEQECQVSHVRQNKVICNTCEETYYDLPSKIYLLEITVKNNPDFSWLKLGYARNISNRIKQYGLPDNAVVKKLKVINIATGREAIKIEKSMHTKYRRKKLPNSQMKKFHVFGGFAECYPMEMLDTLVEELVSAK